ncbi:hypothetical protein HN937_01950, partial [Candidatus Poribacteria bacterium]|nr:hypothetical protein [Candidatus Poribacteria bacterium]
YAVALGDVDGDGDVDVAVGNTSEQNVVYLNHDQPFEDVAAAAGVDDSGTGRGVAWGDYDGDGDLDLYLSKDSGANRLFRNNGNGTFADVSAAPMNDGGSGHGAVWGDYDNDGDPDLYLVNVGTTNKLFRNDGSGTFSDVTGTAGVGDTGVGRSVAWADYDGDGDLDLYVVNWGNANKLYQNDGDGTFTDVGGEMADAGNSPGAAWGDYDNDGDLDLYLAKHSVPNRLYQNDGDGTFTDVQVAAGVAHTGNGEGVAWGDYDSDGDLDLYVGVSSAANVLYQNDGDGTFTDASAAPLADTGYAQSVLWGDYDNDGDLDLYVTNFGQANKLFRNDGGTFSDYSAAGGVDDASYGTGTAWGDYDGDGDLDLYLVNNTANRLFENDGNANHWLQVELEGTVSNRDGIGAVVYARTGATRQRRDVDGGSGLYSQSSLPVEFGLGSATLVDSVIVVWSSGSTQVLTDVAVDDAISIRQEGNTFDEVAEAAGLSDARTFGVSWADYDGDGDLDLYLARQSASNKLFSNDDDGTFTEVTGTPLNDGGAGNGVAWGDYDNDGDADLYVVNATGGGGSTNRLLRNDGGGTFVDAGGTTADAGSGRNGVWGDYNNDGDLDLYLVNHNGTNRLYSNDGDGTFTDASAAPVNDGGAGSGAAWGDYDDDGDLDLYLARHSVANKLFSNDGDGTFTEVTAAPLDDAGGGYGPSWADYDRDGDLDLYLANDGTANRLFQNDGGSFTDVAVAAGVDDSGSIVGAAWGDYDNDGHLDLYLSNWGGRNRLFHSDGDGTFTDVGVDEAVNDAGAGEGVAWGDYDGDGDLDLYVGNVVGKNRLFENKGNANHYLQVELEGTESNDSGIGAVVYAVTGTDRRRWDVDGGAGWLSQSSLPAEFGLGGATTVDSLIVDWPSGLRNVRKNVAADQQLTLSEQLAPTVDSVAPAADEFDAPVAANVSATFSEAMSGGTFAGFVVDGSMTGRRSGTFAGAATATLTFDPADDFLPGEEIQVVFTAGSTTGLESSLSRVPLDDPYVWKFTAAAASAPGRFPVERTVGTGLTAVYSVHSSDVDGDGDLDVLGASSDIDDISWFENTAGNGSAWTKRTVAGAFDGARAVHSSDVDGDGDLDILGAASTGDDVAWFENTAGDGSAWTEHTVDGNFNGSTSVYSSDVDGDGDLDVLGAASTGNAVAWFENTAGDGSAWTKHTVDGAFNGAIAVYSSDVDVDGDLDILGAARNDDVVAWFENTAGDGSAWTEHTVEGAFDGVFWVHSSDVDGDGDPDILGAATIDDDVAWFENTAGDGSAWTEHTVAGDFDYAISVIPSDVDGDGDLDILSAAHVADEVAWFENTAGDGSAWTEHAVAGNFESVVSLFSSDVDGDGDLDILGAARDGGTIAWWENRALLAETTVAAGLTGAGTAGAAGELQLFSIGLTGDGATTVSGVTLTLEDLVSATGLVGGDFAELRLYSSADGTLDEGDTQIGTQTTVNVGAATIVTADTPDMPPADVQRFYFVTALLNTAVTDGHAFRVSFAGGGVSTNQGGVGTAVMADDANKVTIDVVADRLAFATQPAPLTAENGAALDFATDPVVEARDQQGNVDLDFVDTVTLTKTGAGTATYVNNSATAVVGVATFTDLAVTYTGSVGDTFTLQADDTAAGGEGDIATLDATSAISVTNGTPAIGEIANQSIDEDGDTGALSFVVGDAETPVASLTVSGASDNLTLVPVANIVFGGADANRTVTVTPVANGVGSATITLTVSDGTLTADEEFVLTVGAVDDVPTISEVANQSIDEDGDTGALSFVVDDAETPVASLTVSGAS